MDTATEPRKKKKRGKRPPQAIVMQTRAMLAALYPKAFKGFGEDKIPLKIKIDKDVVRDIRSKAPGVTRNQIRHAISDYVRGDTYLRNLIEGAPRFGLNGEVDGFVTARQAEIAVTAMKERAEWRARTKARKQKESEAT